ncbi:hypothetical protein D3C74_49600 [compost metagenome]
MTKENDMNAFHCLPYQFTVEEVYDFVRILDHMDIDFGKDPETGSHSSATRVQFPKSNKWSVVKVISDKGGFVSVELYEANFPFDPATVEQPSSQPATKSTYSIVDFPSEYTLIVEQLLLHMSQNGVVMLGDNDSKQQDKDEAIVDILSQLAASVDSLHEKVNILAQMSKTVVVDQVSEKELARGLKDNIKGLSRMLGKQATLAAYKTKVVSVKVKDNALELHESVSENPHAPGGKADYRKKLEKIVGKIVDVEQKLAGGWVVSVGGKLINVPTKYIEFVVLKNVEE